jgi:hypothetical protein
MNDLGVELLAIAARCLFLALFGMVVLLVCRRRGPATAALAAQASLTAMVAVAAMAACPWPRWWSPAAARASLERPSAGHAAAPMAGGLEPVARSPEFPGVKAGVRADDTSWVSAFVAEFGQALRRSSPPDAAQGWRWPAWLAAVYLAGVGLLLLRLALGIAGVRAVRRRAPLIDDPGLLALIEELRDELAVTAPVELRESTEMGTPATVGWRHPAILLPEDWRGWEAAERRAVLAHELAHIQRGDCAACLWARFCLALHFYQPLAHWLAGRLHLHQELAADAWGARIAGGNASYMQTLARLALRRDERRARWPARAFFPVRGTLTRRIEMLRDAKPTTDLRPRRRSAVLTFATLALAGLFLAGLRGPAAPAPAAAQAEVPRRAGTETPPAAGAFDLSLVPASTGMFLIARPAALAACPELQPLAGLLGPEGDIARQLGIGPAQVEQVAVVWLHQAGPGPNRGGPAILPAPTAVIVRLDDAGAMAPLVARLIARPEEAEYAGQKYVGTSGAPNGPALARIDERTIVLSRRTVELKRYLAARLDPGRHHTFDDAWSAMGKNPAALAVDSVFLVQLFDPDEAGPQAAKFDAFSPLWLGAHAHALGLDVTKGLTLELASACNADDDRSAGKVQKTLEALATLAGNALPGMRKGADGRPGGPAALLDVAEALLGSARIERDGKMVHVRAAAPGVDVAALVKGVVLPAQASARSASRRAQSVNHMKMLGLAMHNYHSKFGHFPPAVVIGPDGKTPHSWRVELLPFLEQHSLYTQYKMDEPWDSPANRKVLEARPELFGYPGSGEDPMHSAYFVVVGPKTMFPPGGKGTKIAQVTDGTSWTIMVVEAKRPIPWTKPEDIPFDPDGPLPTLGGYQPESQGFNAAFGDGSVKFVNETVNPSVLKALLTAQGGEVMSADSF